MASFHSRLNTEPKRVHWLFHGVTSESGDGLSTQKSYPERSSLTSTCQPQPCTSVVSAACCGRGRVRRRLHRPSYQFPEFTLTFSTLNVQSLRFDRIAHRGKLQELITLYVIMISTFAASRRFVHKVLSFSSGTLKNTVLLFMALRWPLHSLILYLGNGKAQADSMWFVPTHQMKMSCLSLFRWNFWTLAATCNYIAHTNTDPFVKLADSKFGAEIGMAISVRGMDRPRNVVLTD